MSEIALKRKRTFASRDEALANFRSRTLFANWDADALAGYIQCGFVGDGEVSLACSLPRHVGPGRCHRYPGAGDVGGALRHHHSRVGSSSDGIVSSCRVGGRSRHWALPTDGDAVADCRSGATLRRGDGRLTLTSLAIIGMFSMKRACVGRLAGYGFDELAEDVGVLREHVGLEKMTLLAHSAACTTALVYAANHPDHCELSSWWHQADGSTTRSKTTPKSSCNGGATRIFWQAQVDGQKVQARLGLVEAPVLVITGALDAMTGVTPGVAWAGCFPNASHQSMTRSGHNPWVDQADTFAKLVRDFLSSPAECLLCEHRALSGEPFGACL